MICATKDCDRKVGRFSHGGHKTKCKKCLVLRQKHARNQPWLKKRKKLARKKQRDKRRKILEAEKRIRDAEAKRLADEEEKFQRKRREEQAIMQKEKDEALARFPEVKARADAGDSDAQYECANTLIDYHHDLKSALRYWKMSNHWNARNMFIVHGGKY
jgi:hypothetical protein